MRCFAGLLLFTLVCAAAPQTAPDGQALFQKNCALCHKPDADNRAPTFEALKWVPNGAIVTALESGAMKVQGATLTKAERQAIADFLAHRPRTQWSHLALILAAQRQRRFPI